MQQLAKDESVNFPLGAKILSEETYMDDVLSGGHSLDEALSKQDELIKICKVGGFNLHKWLANNELLLNLPQSLRANSNTSNSCFSLFGIDWNPLGDYFSFCISTNQFQVEITKRAVLSRIAKIYDPLGWLTPVIMTAKKFIQKLWLAKINWDDVLPSYLRDEFLNWYNSLYKLNEVKIHRWVDFKPDSKCELYDFADASKTGFGACVYLKITNNGNSSINLIAAKSKIAPIKPVLTIPKLELSAALLLSRLTVKVLKALKLQLVDIYLFTDSTDVLFWLKDHPSKWPTFVGNRCSRIHSLLPEAYWSHVRTHENPADCASRGISPDELLGFSLWWEGNSKMKKQFEFARHVESFQIKNVSSLCCNIESKVNKKVTNFVSSWDLLYKYSSLSKLLRMTAYILRFVYNILLKIKSKYLYSSTLFSSGWFKLLNEPNLISVSSLEINRAKLVWVYLVQHSCFKSEIKLLRNNSKLFNTELLRLDPFLEENLLRLGGRLHNSLLSYDQKHPFILPGNSRFSKLLVDFYHLKSLHGGISLTISSIRQEFWITKLRNLVKFQINKCIGC